MKKVSFFMMVTVLLVVLSGFSGCFGPSGSQNEDVYDIIYVNFLGGADFDNIQDAIEASSDNDHILVSNGTYLEHILIDKPITLIGSHPETTIVDASYEGTGITILTDGVTIRNFSVIHSGLSVNVSDYDSGIKVHSNNNMISECILSNNFAGMQILSDDNIISSCYVNNNHVGIYAWKAKSNQFINNFIFSSSRIGIFFYFASDFNLIRSNNFENNSLALRFQGANNNTVVKNIISNNEQGLTICCGANGNVLYLNEFIENRVSHANDETALNQWYDLVSKRGNYWDDHVVIDVDDDGIIDNPYNITDDGLVQDLFPLVNGNFI